MNYVAIIMTAAEVMESVLDIGLNLMELFFFIISISSIKTLRIQICRQKYILS